MARTQVEQIKERLDIVEVIGGYVELHKAGRHFKGKSPFTSEKTPSFFVSPERGMYYCFSSQKGGDLFTFVQEMEGVDFRGALKILADKAGIELVPEDPKKRDARDQQYALLEEATKFFFKAREALPEVTKYVKDRGVTGETIHTWRIGYAPDEWRALRSYLRSKKFTDEEILKAGLIKQADGGKEPYDVFRDRVMFPIMDASGRVVAFSGRTLKKDDAVPKYVNSPETELFQKSEILYGYDKARQGIRHYDFSLIVEGQFDVVLCHQAGYQNAVAVSGTALTPQHVALLGRLSNRVVLALDADGAGVRAVKRSALLLLKKGMDVKVAHMVDGKDPADMIKNDPKMFKKVVGSAVHVIEFLLEVLRGETKDDRTMKLRTREEILPLITAIPNQIDQEHFEGVVAESLGSSRETIHLEIRRMVEDQLKHSEESDILQNAPQRKSQMKNRKEDLIRYLTALTATISREDLLRASIEKELDSFVPTSERERLTAPSDAVYAEMLFTSEKYVEEISERQLREEVTGRLTELAHIIARERLAALRERIRQAETDGDEETLARSLAETKDAEKLLQKEVILP